ncbi:hypothetical protein ACGFH8_30860 [Micromonospora sp. NPDC049175]|uniref:hypothetical protein n=1 Tax=Micromonospora sp. NPDC049175 TaxID=3364266 RepID=UPI003722E36B
MNRQRVLYAALSTGLAAWLVNTAAGQLPDQRFDHLLERGPLRLLRAPNWRFFGPNPGVSDMHLLYRDLTSGTATEWKEIELVPDRPWYGLFWNATNRVPKVIFDALQVTVKAANESSADLPHIVANSGYQLLKRYLLIQVPHEPGADHTQFMMLQGHPEDEGKYTVKPMFASEHIPLTSALPAAATAQ